MTPLDAYRALARYNDWMNRRIYAACAGIADGERRRDRGAFFASIHGTLNHLLLADRLWMARFTGVDFERVPLDTELYADFGRLRAERERTDADILAWVAGLAPADLDRELAFRTLVREGPYACPLWWALSHFFNHQTHHRGQVTTLMAQAGADPGITDLMWMEPGPGPVASP